MSCRLSIDLARWERVQAVRLEVGTYTYVVEASSETGQPITG